MKSIYKSSIKEIKPYLKEKSLFILELENSTIKKIEEYHKLQKNTDTSSLPLGSNLLNHDDYIRECGSLSFEIEKKDFDKFLQEKNISLPPDSNYINLEIFESKSSYQPNYIRLKSVEEYTNLKLIFDKDEVRVSENISIEEVLKIASYLSRFPFLKYSFPKNFTHKIDYESDFNKLSYSARRKLFSSILLGRRPSKGLIFLDHLKILEIILPELTSGKNLSQNRFHAYDIFEHSIRACDGVEKANIILRWSALLHDIGKVGTRKVNEDNEANFYNHEMLSAHQVVPIMKRLGVPKESGQKVRFLVRNHMFHYTKEWTDKAVRRFTKKIEQEDLESLILLRLADRKGSGKKQGFPKGLKILINRIRDIHEKEKELKITDLHINGYTLMEMGLQPGKNMGNILQQLLNEVKEGHLQNKLNPLKERAKHIINSFGLITQELVSK